MSETKELVWLTTIDNPFNPFTEFDAWLREDLRLGHNCLGKIDDCGYFSDALSDYDNENEWVRAIDEVVDTDPVGYYIKVFGSANAAD